MIATVRPERRYVLISPCRDEAEHMRATLESVAQQTVPPAEWIVVDDGSTDQTPRILEEYQRRLPYLRVVRREDRGRRQVGPGVIDAFYAGYEQVRTASYEYICKMDLDLKIPPHYFEAMIERMERDPALGTCSGKPYYRDRKSGRLVSEKCGDETSVGMIKFYRRECFERIGGFVRAVMWDGIDCHRCRMLGWKARSWDEPDLRFLHLRPMGSSERGVLRGRFRHGQGQWFMGSSPVYMAVSAAYRATRPPLILGGLAMWCGYAAGALRRAPRYSDPAFRGFLRRYQRACLLRGKRRATERFEDAPAARRGGFDAAPVAAGQSAS